MIDDAAIEALERQVHENRAAVVARFAPSSRARVGDVIDMAVDVTQLHLFDPATGLAIRA